MLLDRGKISAIMFILEVDMDMFHITVLFPAFVPSWHLQSFLANTDKDGNKGDTDGDAEGAPHHLCQTFSLQHQHVLCDLHTYPNHCGACVKEGGGGGQKNV